MSKRRLSELRSSRDGSVWYIVVTDMYAGNLGIHCIATRYVQLSSIKTRF